MGDVLVRGGNISEGRITELSVDFHGLPARTIDRDTALSLMGDGHSFVPVQNGERLPLLLLVEVGEEHFIRNDPSPEPADTLPF